MKLWFPSLLGAFAIFVTSSAFAEEEAFGHMGQIGVRAGLVAGYRMVLRYDDSPYCHKPDPKKAMKDQVKFCGFGAPVALNLAASFALLDFFEPYFWVRLGLARDENTDTDPVKILGIGARLYTMSDSAFKIYVEPAIAYEFEGGGQKDVTGLPGVGYDPNYKKDVVFHLAAGPHWDFHKNFGAYVSGGISSGILRALSSSLELDFGVQGRFP